MNHPSSILWMPIAMDWFDWSTWVRMLKMDHVLMKNILSGLFGGGSVSESFDSNQRESMPIGLDCDRRKIYRCKSGNNIGFEEVTVIASTHRSDYGMVCVQCGDLLVAPGRSEYVSERQVRHRWCCSECGCTFETSVVLPKTAQSIGAGRGGFFPSLLAA